MERARRRAGLERRSGEHAAVAERERGKLAECRKPPSLRILVADDHAIVREGLKMLLRLQANWEVCAEAGTGREAVEKVRQFRPDVVVLDIWMPELNGLEATRQILQVAPRTEIVILTMHESERVVREALDAGARGYVLKADAATDLVSAVTCLAQHKPFFSPRASELILKEFLERPESLEQASITGLTQREREIVQLLSEGKSNKQVGASLGISAKTVEVHRTNIMRKLGLHSITDLVHYAIRNKIIQP